MASIAPTQASWLLHMPVARNHSSYLPRKENKEIVDLYEQGDSDVLPTITVYLNSIAYTWVKVLSFKKKDIPYAANMEEGSLLVLSKQQVDELIK